MSNLAIVFLICLTILSFLFSSKNHSTPIAKLSLTYNEIKNEEVETDWKRNLHNLIASEIFYHYPNSIKEISVDLQNLLLGLHKKQKNNEGVSGIEVRNPSGKKIGWTDMYSLFEYFKSNSHNPHLNSYFGPNCYKELKELFNLNNKKTHGKL